MTQFCYLCGDKKFDGFLYSKNWNGSVKKKKSKYCQKCKNIKSDMKKSDFLSHINKIINWQNEYEEYIQTLLSPFPCNICGEEHMTRVGGATICSKCINIRNENIKLEREKANALCEIIEKKNQRRVKIAQDINNVLLNDKSWQLSSIGRMYANTTVFLKEEMRITPNFLTVELWDLPNGRKNKWRNVMFSDVSNRLPDEINKIVSDNPDIFKHSFANDNNIQKQNTFTC